MLTRHSSRRRREEMDLAEALRLSTQEGSPLPPSSVAPSGGGPPSAGSQASSVSAAARGRTPISSGVSPFHYPPSFLPNSVSSSESPFQTPSTITGELERGLDPWTGPPGHPQRPPDEPDSSYGNGLSRRGPPPPGPSTSRSAVTRPAQDDDDDDVVPDSDEDNQIGQYTSFVAWRSGREGGDDRDGPG